MEFLNPITWIDAALEYICTLIKLASFNLYNLSFFILIVLCMYYVIQAVCGSNTGKIKAVSTIIMFAIIEMVKTMLLG